MGKGKKRGKALRAPEAPPSPKFRLGTRFRVALVALLAVGLVAGYSLTRWESSEESRGARVEISASPGGGLLERRPTLPPSLFVGQVARAYRVAQEIPEVLDKLYCYCACKENMGHLNLLTCYTGRHASTCDICVDQALMASRLTEMGYDPASIQKAIDKKFG